MGLDLEPSGDFPDSAASSSWQMWSCSEARSHNNYGCLILLFLESERGSSGSLAGQLFGVVSVVISGDSVQVYFFSSAHESVHSLEPLVNPFFCLNQLQ